LAPRLVDRFEGLDTVEGFATGKADVAARAAVETVVPILTVQTVVIVFIANEDPVC
jgi:hypothetical protein